MTRIGDQTIDDTITLLEESFDKADMQDTKEQLDKLWTASKTNKAVGFWASIPENVTYLHTHLSEVYDVPRRAMQLRTRIPNVSRRGMLFLTGMLNGVVWVEKKNNQTSKSVD